MDTIKFNKKQVKMVAHRGASGLERENTVPAFVAAGNRSYFGVETDVHKTADGLYVIIHDETTSRVSRGAVNIHVEENPYEAVRHIVLPDKDGSTVRLFGPGDLHFLCVGELPDPAGSPAPPAGAVADLEGSHR